MLLLFFTKAVCGVDLSFEELHTHFLHRINLVLVGCIKQRLDVAAVHRDPKTHTHLSIIQVFLTEKMETTLSVCVACCASEFYTKTVQSCAYIITNALHSHRAV